MFLLHVQFDSIMLCLFTCVLYSIRYSDNNTVIDNIENNNSQSNLKILQLKLKSLMFLFIVYWVVGV